MLGLSLEAVKDIGERALRTFLQVFAALYMPVILGADSLNGLLDLSTAEKAATAAIAAVFSLVMGVIGVQAGSSKDDASIR